MVNCHQIRHETKIKQVQVTDLENAAYLPQGRCIKGMLAGNDNWRSPEGHFKGELNKPSDMFSFGAVVSGLTEIEIPQLTFLVYLRRAWTCDLWA
jgi:hypothetical protein